MRKTLLTALAFATLTSAAFVGQVAPAAAQYGGYYNPGNGYYCTWKYIRVPYKWDYYGNPIAWRTVRRCV
jgi:hypothetical protein